MEWNITLRRTQSLKSFSDSNDNQVWRDTGLPDKNTSVSDLVARYQTAVSGSTIIQATPAYHSTTKQAQVLQEKTPPPQKTPPKGILKKTDNKSQVKANLTPAKSMDSLQSNTKTIMNLRALYEAKGTTTDKEKSSLRAANSSPHMRDVAVMNGEARDATAAAKNEKSLKAVQKVSQTETKQEHVAKKAGTLDRVERRKTIGGIDFERNAAADADEKRRSIADFRSIQSQEKLSVSVKVMSALYLSKVSKESKTPVKPEHNLSPESVKRGRSFQMAEDPTSFQGKDGLPPPPSGAEDRSGAYYQASQVSKEMLYQQRQKCELRRLLKHTHPELKMLDDVVDEELAEVLSSERETAGETGYEGEVFSRCLIFENSGLKDKVSPNTPKMHMGEGTAEKCDVKKLSAVFEEPKEKPHTGTVKELAGDDKSLVYRPESDRDCEEENVKIDVQATRRLFESQHVNTGRSNSDRTVQTNISVSADETNAQIQNMEIDMCRKHNLQSQNKRIDPDLEKQPDKQVSFVHAVGQNSESEIHLSKDTSTAEILFEEKLSSSAAAEGCLDAIKTSAALLQNNPFVSTNIERENSHVHTSKSQTSARDGGTGEDCLVANVRNRTHLFESMPFGKIRQQNKDEIETMVENIKETLDFLYKERAIHSVGSIIEVNETMIAKKAKFTMSQCGPEIRYDEVAEGGAQNFVLHSLPRVNLKPQITYLKEDSKGCMTATVVNVPVHQRQVHTTKDTECKTANVAQLVEDILNQDNSLRKGVIIQQDVNNSAEVIVYSLYKYFDEEDVKTYSPAQGAEYYEPQPESGETGKTLDKETRKGIIDSAKRSFLDTFQDQTCPGFLRPEVTEKGNVKLFKSCIEKGDYDYLKTLQTEATAEEQEPPQNEPVTRQDPYEQKGDFAEESTSEWVPVDINRLKSIFSGNPNQIQPKPNIYDNCSQSTLTSTAGQNVLIDQKQYVQNTSTASVLNAQSQANNSKVTLRSSFLSFDGQDDDRVLQAELVQVIDENDEISDLQTAIQELQQATVKAKALYHSSGEKGQSLPQESSQEDSVSIVHSSETMPEQEEEEVVFQGKVQAALDSLEKSNINVTKGDFRAAMIYRNSSKPCQERSQNTDVLSIKKSTEMFCPNTPQEPLVKEPSATNAKPPQETRTSNKPVRGAVSDKNKRPVGPKPVIPPKPEHLMMKERNGQSSHPKDVQATQNNTATPKEMFPKSPHTMMKTTVPCQDEVGQELFKSNRDSLEPQSAELSSKCEQMTREPDIICSAVTDNKVITKQQTLNVTADEKSHQHSSTKDGLSENEEKHVDFHEACQKFGGKKASPKKIAPVKPKRVKIAQPVEVVIDPSCHAGRHSDDSEGKQEKAMTQENRVEMREKKGRTETEDERRQRLSVHMDEIMRGNITTAMEIFDNLRKQEELQSLLSRVEEIEEDTSEVDVKSLTGVFENVPDWVVSADKREQIKVKEENKDKVLPSINENTPTKMSMAHVFGDLERASEEIMNLKEQTLAKLVDIEGTIKKALYSVSTLKSDADIAGLSCLFKESLGAVQGSPSSGNISKISIESSRKKSQQANESVRRAKAATEQSAEASSLKQRSSPPSSPAFISIESAARKTDRAEAGAPETLICRTCQQSPKVEEKFRTTKTLTCNSPATKRKGEPRRKGQKQATCSQPNPNREVSVFEVHTDHEGKSVLGTKTVTENYERTDNFGNRFYSSKTSTVVTPQPETTTSSTSPGTNQVTTYPEVQLPVNQMPQ